MKSSIWLIVLGAGLSTRMGEPKMLLDIDGEPLVRYIATKALSVQGIEGVVLVINDRCKEVAQQVSDLPMRVLVNPDTDHGMSTSLSLALESLPDSATAAMIWLADLPELETDAAETLIAEYVRTQALIVQASYEDQPNHPVLFDRHLFTELRNVTGDQGGRSIIKRYAAQRVLVPVDKLPPSDLDTQEDYIQFIQQRRRNS